MFDSHVNLTQQVFATRADSPKDWINESDHAKAVILR